MAKKTFSSDNQPSNRRGPGKRPMLSKAIEKALGRDETECLEKLIRIGFGLEDGQKNTAILSQLFAQLTPPIKSSLKPVVFEFPKDGSPPKMAMSILVAAADGKIPPDVAKVMLDGLNAVLQIEVNSQLKERILELERLAGVNQ